jgi:hypothetical protein
MSELDVGVLYPPPPDHGVSVVYKFEMGNSGPKLSINVMPKFHGVLPALSRAGWRHVNSELEELWAKLEATSLEQQP